MSALRIGAVGLLIVGAVAVGYAAGGLASPQPVSYWEIEDRVVGLMVVAGPASSCVVASADEESSDVRVSIKCRDPIISIGSTGAGYKYFFELQLQEPLGGRTLLDGTGAPAIKCAEPRC